MTHAIITILTLAAATPYVKATLAIAAFQMGQQHRPFWDRVKSRGKK